jgi:hypothetical protein
VILARGLPPSAPMSYADLFITGLDIQRSLK